MRKKRYLWSNQSELKLLNTWREYVYELRKTKRNWHVYKEMTRKLNIAGVSVSAEEIKTKVANMTQRYRAVKRVVEISGEPPSDWPLYDKINKMLRPFKFNDDYVANESINVECDETPSTSVFGTHLILPPSPSSSSISACSRIGKQSNSSPMPQMSLTSVTSPLTPNPALPSASFTSWASEKRKDTAIHDKQATSSEIEAEADDSLNIKSEDENQYPVFEKQVNDNGTTTQFRDVCNNPSPSQHDNTILSRKRNEPSCSNNDERTDESHAYIKPVQQDEYATFGKLVTEKLQNLRTPRLRSIAQHRISNIFFELETCNENA